MITIKKFKITGMHCSSCAFSIDGDLEDTDGIKESSTNFAKAQTEVKFDPEKVNEKEIVKLIKKVGYDATLATN
jgi:copper chaperone CopZ